MRVSMQEFSDRLDALAERAEVEPVTIVQGDRDRLVLVSALEYERLLEHERLKEQRRDLADAAPPARTAPGDAPQGGLSDLRGSMRHTITYVADDIAEPIGEVWKAER